MTRTIDIDIRGRVCPCCLLPRRREINGNSAAVRTGSAAVMVVTDDRHATATIPATAARMGFNTEVARRDGTYRIRIFGSA